MASSNNKKKNEKEEEKKKAADIRERKIKMIKELDDIIRKTPEGEIRTDLEFTKDKLISSLYNENEEDDDKQKEKEVGGEKKK